jgi:hypothetical protein
MLGKYGGFMDVTRAVCYAALVTALSIPGTLAGQTIFMSGTRGIVLNKICATSTPLEGESYSPCTSFITGAADALALEGSHCLPMGAEVSQQVAVVRKYVADHPEQWQKHSVLLIKVALSRAFPCRQK